MQSEDSSSWSLQASAISGDAGSRQQLSVSTESVSTGWPGQLAGNTLSWVLDEHNGWNQSNVKNKQIRDLTIENHFILSLKNIFFFQKQLLNSRLYPNLSYLRPLKLRNPNWNWIWFFSWPLSCPICLKCRLHKTACIHDIGLASWPQWPRKDSFQILLRWVGGINHILLEKLTLASLTG